MAFITILRQISHCKSQNVPKTTLAPLKILSSLPRCQIHCSPVNRLFFEDDPKSEYKKFRPKPSKKEILRHGLKQIKEEIQIWKSEISEALAGDNLLAGMPGVVDKQFQFRNELDLKTWLVTSDRDNEEGDSHCDLKINQNGKGLFSGNLCLDVPKDGRISKTGYCNMRTIRYKRSFQRDAHYDWGMYTHVVIRCRGDGRSYGINLSTSSYFDQTWNDVFTYVLFTRGGPYWQYSKIPFSKFFFTSKGRIQDIQSAVPLFRIASLGITLAERAPGPFALELDFIGLENDPTHKETFAYEMYRIPSSLAAT